jgi:integrase
MSSIKKRRGRNGKLADRYSIRYKDANGDWKTAVGCVDLESTRKLAAKLESEATLQRHGVRVETNAELPIDDFRSDLESSGCVQSHVDLTVNQIETTFKACGITTLRDLLRPDVATKINSYLANKKRESRRKGNVKYKTAEKLGSISARTRNAYVTSIRQFCKWCVDNDRLPECKLARNLAKVEQTDKLARHAATDDELGQVLTSALNGSDAEGLSGEERYWLYRVATATGFRASELRSLTPAAFKLREATPRIVLAGGDSKNGKGANQPIRPELAADLARWLRGKAKDEPVWPGQWHKNAAEMLRVDLDAAKVPASQPDGVFDFHALRHTYVTGLVRAGVSPRYAQQLARHSTIDLTMRVYTHLGLEEVAAVLPACAQPARTADGKTRQSGSTAVTRRKRA